MCRTTARAAPRAIARTSPDSPAGELWFDDLDAAQAAMGTAQWRAVIHDGVTFMDMQRISAIWAEEHGF